MRAKVIRWVIVLLPLVLITRNLLAQPTPPRPDGWLPTPSTQPTAEPYPWPRQPTTDPTTDPYPVPPTLCPTAEPYPWPTIPARTPWPVIPTRTPTTDPTTFAATETRLRLLSPELYEQHRRSIAPTPTRDPQWEAEFEVVHSRQPDAQDTKDRQWSLSFLARTGQPPTDEEWIAHWYLSNES